MPFFSKVFRHRDAATGVGKTKTPVAGHANGHAIVPARPKFVSTWTSTEIDPDEVQELIHACTREMKSRAAALEAPFFFLPFRPETDVSAARTFIGNFYTANHGGSTHYAGDSLRRELVLTEPAVLCSILKWCWSRMPGGVVTWTTYEGFRLGEHDSRMARNAFSTFIPLCVDTPARSSIIFDFFDLLATIAAHAKLNGLGGRKLSRMAAWWAFDHEDESMGFDGGYRSWATAADASSHLFFAYLRSLSPEYLDGFSGINALPRSLQALLAQTEYPPEKPTLMQKKTPKVVMLVHSVSSGPFALLRRAKHFEYRDEELQAFSEYDDPVRALTAECKRVLNCIATANQSMAARSRSGMNLAIDGFGLGSKQDESWSQFQDFGFADFSNEAPKAGARPRGQPTDRLRSAPHSIANNKGRPTTPSWADFLNTGFTDESAKDSAAVTTLSLPSDKVLPPLGNSQPPNGLEEDLEPGELASISTFDLDDTFWWVWMTSLASEEPAGRKAVFGRCALIETGILGGRWLLMEEQLKGNSPEPEDGAYIAEKKSRFGFSRRNKQSRRRSEVVPISPVPQEANSRATSTTPSKSTISPDQQARIKAAAASLTQQSTLGHDQNNQRRGRYDDAASAKTNSIMTLGLTSEAGPAMKWARDFDKDTVRKQYLGDNYAGKGNSDIVLGGQTPSIVEENTLHNNAAWPSSPPKDVVKQELPPVPQEHVQPTAEVIDAQDEALVTPTPSTDEFHGRDLPTEQSVNIETPAKPSPNLVSQSIPVVEASVDSGIPASPKLVQIQRKPVPRTAPRLNNIHEHPAFRNKVGGANPAEKAAKQAWGMETQKLDPASPNKVSQSGFRKLFGKRREDDGKRNSLVLPQSQGSLKPPSESSLVRKLSHMRRKTPTPQHDSSAAISVSSAEPTTASGSPDLRTPTAPDHRFADESSIARVDTQDHADAEHAFERFDQGPLTDAPAFTPRESMDLADLPTNSPHAPVDIDHIGAPGAFPETPMEYGTPKEPIYENDGKSEASMFDPQDRWAQIRKNAAERAARMSEDQHRPEPSILTERTDEDGYTSGEETIEDRVARIRARVAELTGNIIEPASNEIRR